MYIYHIFPDGQGGWSRAEYWVPGPDGTVPGQVGDRELDIMVMTYQNPALKAVEGYRNFGGKEVLELIRSAIESEVAGANADGVPSVRTVFLLACWGYGKDRQVPESRREKDLALVLANAANNVVRVFLDAAPLICPYWLGQYPDFDPKFDGKGWVDPNLPKIPLDGSEYRQGRVYPSK